jgi:hypothetical protein
MQQSGVAAVTFPVNVNNNTANWKLCKNDKGRQFQE